MTNQNIQNFIDALVDLHDTADKDAIKSIESCLSTQMTNEQRDAADSHQIRCYHQMTVIRDVLLKMDTHLPGTKRMVRRAFEKIAPHFAKGYYSTKKKGAHDVSH